MSSSLECTSRWARIAYDESEEPVPLALEINRTAFGDIHPSVSSSLNTLAAVHRRRGEYDKAESLIRQALEIDLEILGNEHPALAYPLTNLGDVLREKGDYEQAESAHRRALHLVKTSAAENGIEDVGVGIIAGFVTCGFDMYP
ncbi:MAG: tetratricopeptide repeat protein [Rhodothermales bacterium]|nr:tetratricopeptide repeat protein [Rhodothermales bacterium]